MLEQVEIEVWEDIFLKNYEVRLLLHFPSWYTRHFQALLQIYK